MLCTAFLLQVVITHRAAHYVESSGITRNTAGGLFGGSSSRYNNNVQVWVK